MDRDPASAIDADAPSRPDSPDPDLLPTRRAALDAIRSATARGRGLVAITGEPGVGKTTLWRWIEAERRPGESWVAVEVTPGSEPCAIYRLIARGLRVEPAGFGRPELLDFLNDRGLDGERWTLVVDEAQNLGAEAIEEVRVLSNRLGEPDGFAAILLVGQSALARWLAGRAGAALSARLTAHVHLRPLDADEVGRLLDALDPARDWPEDVVDHIHMATGGRPARIIARAAPTAPKPRRPVAPALPEPEPEPIEESPAWDVPLVGPARPPIRVEDGLIEVGWTPEAKSATDGPGRIDGADGREPIDPVAEEERIDDHYAALQAWHEWATNQGRHPEIAKAEAPPPPPDRVESPTPAPKVRAEEEHGFAPFGRLFSRLAQENEAG